MAYNEGSMAVELPNAMPNLGSVLQSGIALKERQQERNDALQQRDRQFAIQQQDRQAALEEKKQMDLYRKSQMIQDLTDLSKHQTGDAVADAIGGQKISELMPKYIALANNGASYTDLLGGITKDMSQTVSGLNGIKDELKQADLITQKAKEVHPNINTGAMLQDLRTDILNRRLDGSNFTNPLQVQPSELASKLNDPEFLSRYVKGAKNITETIQNPKGIEATSALSGSPDSHVKYDAKIPFWMKPNYTSETQKGGFLPSNFVPQLSVKNSVLNPDRIPGGMQTDKPFTIVDKDVYDKFASDDAHNMELIQATRQKYPSYDSWNQTSKEYAKRNVLNDMLEGLDQNQFHPVSSTKPSKNIFNLGNKETPIKDAYSEIVRKLPENDAALAFNKLSPTTQDAVLKLARENYGQVTIKDPNDPNKVKQRPLNQSDILVYKNPETNEVGVWTAKPDEHGTVRIDQFIAPLGQYDVNSQVNKGVKAHNEVVKQDAVASKVGNTYDVGGKILSHDDLKKMGYKDAQIDQALQLGNIKKHK